MKIGPFEITRTKVAPPEKSPYQQAKEHFLAGNSDHAKLVRQRNLASQTVDVAQLPGEYNDVPGEFVVHGQHAHTVGGAKVLQQKLNDWLGTDYWGSTQS